MAYPAITQLLCSLDDVLARLQERIATCSLPEHRFALIHFVEGLSIDAWHAMAEHLPSREWLALPLDAKDALQLLRIREAMADQLFREAKRSGKKPVTSAMAQQKIAGYPALVQVAEKQFLFTGKDAL